MTIFLDIAKYFLIEAFEKERKRAKDANATYIGSMTREIEHSEKKRGLAKTLCEEIQQLKDQRSDQLTWLELKRLIAKYQRANTNLCQKAGIDEGEFRVTLIDANSLLDGIYYHVFEMNKLLDIKCDLDLEASSKFDLKVSPSLKYNDAFDKFIYYCAYYLVQKYKQPTDQTLVQSCWRSLSFTSAIKVGIEKLNLLEETMTTLRSSLASSDQNKQLYRMTRRDTVLLALNAILGGNANLCQTHTLHATLPLSQLGLNFFQLKLPVWEPASGQLKDAMEKAQLEIKSICETKIIHSSDNKKIADNQEELSKEKRPLVNKKKLERRHSAPIVTLSKSKEGRFFNTERSTLFAKTEVKQEGSMVHEL